MSNNEAHKLKDSLEKTKSSLKVIRTVTLILLIGLVLVWVTFLSLMLFDVVTSAELNTSVLGGLMYLFLFGALVVIVFTVALRIFSEVIAGESPFTLKQARRMRTAGVFFLLFAVVESCISAGLSYIAKVSIFNVAVSGNQVSDSFIIHINVTALMIAFIFFAFSAVIKYGVLLQQHSDETL